MNRRAFLKAIASAALLPILPRRLFASTNVRRCRPRWPSPSAWKQLNESVCGNVIPVNFPLSVTDPTSAAATLLSKDLKNPIRRRSAGAYPDLGMGGRMDHQAERLRGRGKKRSRHCGRGRDCHEAIRRPDRDRRNEGLWRGELAGIRLSGEPRRQPTQSRSNSRSDFGPWLDKLRRWNLLRASAERAETLAEHVLGSCFSLHSPV